MTNCSNNLAVDYGYSLHLRVQRQYLDCTQQKQELALLSWSLLQQLAAKAPDIVLVQMSSCMETIPASHH